MMMRGDDQRARQRRAIHESQQLTAWYERNLTRQRIFHRTSQSITIVLGALTPVLILVQVGDLYPALASSIIAVTVGISNIFHWQENYLRFVNAARLLHAERLAFETSTGRYYETSQDAALNLFTTALIEIRRVEPEAWAADNAASSSKETAAQSDAST